MTIGIVGLGLIGGSLAKTIKLHTKHRVLGLDINPQTMLQAQMLEAVDGPLTQGELSVCDLVLVALFPQAIIRFVAENAARFRPGALVVDCGGVKGVVCDALFPLAQSAAWTFIGGHPMAGREFSGFRYARDDLFDHASMILTPPPDVDVSLLARARDFFLEMGFLRVQITTPQAHDEMIAYTSQLAHIVSSAYVKCPLAMKHKGFSAGSFGDMTRVARLNETMWTELFLENQPQLLAETQGLIDRLSAYRDALRARDAEGLSALLREGREVKEGLEE